VQPESLVPASLFHQQAKAMLVRWVRQVTLDVVACVERQAAGLRAGDVVIALDGVQVTDVDQLDAITVTRSPGETVRVTYRRAGASADVTVKLGPLPSPIP
jgi:S1-C subfamily serine protease